MKYKLILTDEERRDFM